MCDHRTQNWLVLMTLQLFYVWTVTFVWTWICTDETQATPLQANGRQCYLRKNIASVVARSAKPPLPPL